MKQKSIVPLVLIAHLILDAVALIILPLWLDVLGAKIAIWWLTINLLFVWIDRYHSFTFTCRHFGWHIQPKRASFDGCSLYGTCPRCGKRVLQDSQGNWS